jgi:hypothetical protein
MRGRDSTTANTKSSRREAGIARLPHPNTKFLTDSARNAGLPRHSRVGAAQAATHDLQCERCFVTAQAAASTP